MSGRHESITLWKWGLDTEYQAVIRRPMVIIEFAKW
mgnify:FL=1|jgi:hypothetical protein